MLAELPMQAPIARNFAHIQRNVAAAD